jgi:type II secretory pathway pseudopilin PulG
MPHQAHSESGVSLIETMIALLILTIAATGMASVFLYGMQSVASGPNELIATQKAAEAIESVFSARDSHTITWRQLRNAADGGVFLPGAQEMRTAGDDGILNTSDDADQPVESAKFPGPDQTLDTLDDVTVTLDAFKREIAIVQLSPTLRQITVVITYLSGTTSRTYVLTSLISAFA